MAGENDKWEMYTDKRGEHRWRRRAMNGNITGAACEGFTLPNHCRHNAERHRMNNNPKNLGVKDNWEFYSDKRNKHRWTRRATNGEVTGCSHRGFVSKAACKANAERNGM